MLSLVMLSELVLMASGFMPGYLLQVGRIFRPYLGPARIFSSLWLAPGISDDDTSGGMPFEPEQSRMMDYISNYLKKEQPQESSHIDDRQSHASSSSENLALATHLIAIPMDTCHELLLELESVQRAILYHCPMLVDACIPGAATRLPLLFVVASNERSTKVTRVLSQLVNEVVKRHLFQVPESSASGSEQEEDIDEELLNADGYRPLTLTFQSLEIDGDNNNVLNTVGVPGNYGTTKLCELAHEFKIAVEAQGWQAFYPPDPKRMSSSSPNDFRPRVPFMELPQEFDDNLSQFKDETMDIKEEDFEFLTSSEGGNGISPIFWCQWWDDVFGRNIRLKEVGIYPRSEIGSILSADLGQPDFYIPYETIALPDGNSAMLQTEQKFKKYQDERMEEEKKILNSEAAVKPPSSATCGEEEREILLSKTFDRLERIYTNSDQKESGWKGGEAARDLKGFDSAEDANVNNESQDDDEILLEDVDLLSGSQQEASQDDFIDDWMKARIRQIVESQESEKARKPVKKDMPPVEDNPVFRAYKDGTLVPKSEKVEQIKRELAPYPSQDHFAGIWKVVSSPTGFPAQESTNEFSENLVLRIDGTTAGGPVFDQETMQKAAGGTWKILEGNDGEVKLRIRMLIPPKKNRVLEMIGNVNRMGIGSDITMASRAFGVPFLEALAKKSSGDTGDFMMCDGDVFLEDAVTSKNRERIGEFSLTKIHGPKRPSEYTITIPKPI